MITWVLCYASIVFVMITFFPSGMGGAMDPDEAGPSGMDNVRVKMEEPEWVDAGALEPNCELAGQYEDNADYNSAYAHGALSAGADGPDFHHFITGQQSQPQQPPLVSIVVNDEFNSLFLTPLIFILCFSFFAWNRFRMPKTLFNFMFLGSLILQ